jgi:SAM-dependent methyltransferase
MRADADVRRLRRPRRPRSQLALVTADGDVLDLGSDRWWATPDRMERAILATLPDPVLDVGCGPGRIVTALAAAGRMALGVDPSPHAVDAAVRRRAPVLRRSVFGPLPGEGRWGSIVLLDGNVGIGGDAEALLRRCAALLRPGGHLVAELEPPSTPSGPVTVRLRAGDAAPTPWFRWARLAADVFPDVARVAGFGRAEVERTGGRWFGRGVRA